MQPNIYQTFELDQQTVKAGIWFEFFDTGGNPVCRMKCRPADPELNPQLHEATTRSLVEAGEANVKTRDANRTLAELYAEAVVVDWEGVTDRKGKTLKCDRLNILEVLTDLPVLFTQLRVKTRDWTLWRRNFTEQALGN